MREWNRIHARLSNKRRLASNKVRKTRARRESGNSHSPIQIGQHKVVPRVTVVCPEDFSLETNFDGVVNTLRKIREESTMNKHGVVYVDFREIRSLSPSAALVLAAELDRWNNLPFRGRLRSIDVQQWDPNVRSLLADMGFFELLSVTQPAEPHSTTRYVKFRTGDEAYGEVIDRLRLEELEPFVGPIPGRIHLYNAVTEAMTNVAQHAYKGTQTHRPNWWLSASLDENAVTIMIYDQGAGIPATLPRKFGEQIRKIVQEDHAEMIRAAHELERTRHEEKYRGHGLKRDVRGYLQYLERGQYRVISLKGEYVYEPLAEGNQHRLYKHSHPLLGTLIEWQLRRRAEEKS